jgi:putative transposase
MAKKSSYRRRNSYRRWDWDYGANACYFVTMVTWQRMRVFGEVGPKGGVLSQAGALVDEMIRALPQYFPFTAVVTHVVMPDHVHILVRLQKSEQELQADPPFIRKRVPGGPIPSCMRRKNLSRTMRWLKGRCTFEIRPQLPAFAWQRSFYDRIMRSESEARRFAAYIDANPIKAWAKALLDKYRLRKRLKAIGLHPTKAIGEDKFHAPRRQPTFLARF